jgi:mannitol/fructose-specific phosphotransferase system IIA component (Ntr-type)
VFLLVTPLEKPALQLFLLSQLARVAGKTDARKSLLETNSTDEVVEILTRERNNESSLGNATT